MFEMTARLGEKALLISFVGKFDEELLLEILESHPGVKTCYISTETVMDWLAANLPSEYGGPKHVYESFMMMVPGHTVRLIPWTPLGPGRLVAEE